MDAEVEVHPEAEVLHEEVPGEVPRLSSNHTDMPVFSWHEERRIFW